MSMKLSQPLTVEEFLAWERRQELRCEFDGVQIIAMTGGTNVMLEQARIAATVFARAGESVKQ